MDLFIIFSMFLLVMRLFLKLFKLLTFKVLLSFFNKSILLNYLGILKYVFLLSNKLMSIKIYIIIYIY
jgi:hypothetical protein